MDIWKCWVIKAYLLLYLATICKARNFSWIFPSLFTEPEESFNPYSPLILCSLIPDEFIICSDPVFVETKNSSAVAENQEAGTCYISEKSYRYESVPTTSVLCNVIDDSIECAGDRQFIKDGIPCVRYTGYCFVTILLQSVFLGCLGVDRFTLGHTGTAVGKLLTLGGVGVWWFVDIILLLTGNLAPADNSDWCIYY